MARLVISNQAEQGFEDGCNAVSSYLAHPARHVRPVKHRRATSGRQP